MKHIKSYEQFLNEAEDKAKEIEAKINKMGEVSDDEKEMEKDMKSSSEGPTTPEEGSKSEADNKAKEDEDEDMGDKHIGESEEMKEKHHLYDERLLKMTVQQVLDYCEKHDKSCYDAIETQLEKAFKDMTPQQEGNFFTTMTA
jgi:hypothetical protein